MHACPVWPHFLQPHSPHPQPPTPKPPTHPHLPCTHNNNAPNPGQVRDHWGFQMTARHEMYAQLLADFVKLDYKPQIIKDPSLK